MKYLVVIYIVIISFGGCSSTSSEPTDKTIDRDLLLSQHIMLGLMDPQMQKLQQSVLSLNQGIQQSCTGDQESSLEVLREQWKLAMNEFHYLSVFNHGPLAQENRAVASLIYSPPGELFKTNIIGAQIKKASKQKAKYKISTEKTIYLGLDSIEYVLFSRLKEAESLTNDSQECTYLAYVSNDVKDRINSVVDVWKNETLATYLSPLVQSDLKSYNATLAKGLIVYSDKVLKDQSLAVPMGIKEPEDTKCIPGENCHTLYFEHPFAGVAQESVEIRLKALEDIFSGQSLTSGQKNFGFNDYLAELDVPLKSVSLGMNQNSLSQEWGTLPAGAEYQELFASYGANNDTDNPIFQSYLHVQAFNTWLKNEFIADLSSKLPGSVQGDND